MDFADLEPMLAPGSDLGALADVLAGLTDKERRSFSGPIRRAADYGSGLRSNQSAVALALLGCATGVRQAASGIALLTLENEALPLAARVLRDRNPAWLPEFPSALLGSKDLRPDARRLVRQLVREGLVPAPDLAAYQTGLARGLLRWPDPRSVLEALQADPEILEHELWDMLACEGVGMDLTQIDNWLTRGWAMPGKPRPPVTPERTWQHALVTLSGDGRISRSRLLDETLTACLRDWKASDSAWYLALHDALAPSLDESYSRQSVYLRLLSAEPGTTVSLAQRALKRLLDADLADVPALVQASAAALSRPDKGTVLAQLKLLQAAASRKTAYTAIIADAVRAALSHSRTDVQERALTLLEGLVPDPVERAALISHQCDALAPTLRSAASATGSAAGTESAGPTPPRLMHDDAEVVRPIKDADELADVLSQLIEEAADPIDVERALEAVARLAGQQPRSGGDALLLRARALLGERYPGAWSGEEVRNDLAALTIVWLARVRPGQGPGGRVIGHHLSGIPFLPAAPADNSPPVTRVSFRSEVRPDWTLPTVVSLRIHEIAAMTAHGGAALLSLPTHRDGSIDPATMLARIQALPRTAAPLPLDTGVAALRLNPADRDALNLPAAHRAARALAAGLKTLDAYQPRWEPVIGPSKGMYRDAFERAATWRDSASRKGNMEDAVAAVLDRHDPLRLLGLEAHDGEYTSRFEQVTALWPLLLPHHPELLAAHAHARLNRALTKNRSGTAPLLDALARSRARTGPVACSALVLGLSAKNGDERTHAVDALADLADADMLDGHELGTQTRRLLVAGVVTGTRIAGSLAEADRASPHLAGALLDALQTLLPGLPGRRDAHLFVDLAAQLATRQGRTVTLPEEFLRLRDGKANTGLAAACRRIPA